MISPQDINNIKLASDNWLSILPHYKDRDECWDYWGYIPKNMYAAYAYETVEFESDALVSRGYIRFARKISMNGQLLLFADWEYEPIPFAEIPRFLELATFL
jgi:hypothetical protein